MHLTAKIFTQLGLRSALFVSPFLALASSVDAQQVRGIDATIALDQAVFRSGEPIEVDVTFTNETHEPISFLCWNTPFDVVFFDMFEVTWNGQTLPYEGRTAFRLPPTRSDFVVLEPFESISTAVDISNFYDLKYDGSYSVSLASFVPPSDVDMSEFASAGWGTLASNGVAFTVEGGPSVRQGHLHGDDLGQGGGGGVVVDSTDDTVVADPIIDFIVDAVKEACMLAKAAKECVKGDDYFKKWFGGTSDACVAKVKKNFCAIVDAFDKQLNFCIDLGCAPGVVAYVYPCQPCKIYLCPPFFQPNPIFTPGGVIIHELSHFKNVAGTKDHAYLCKPCCDLAMTDPAKAKENADTYRLFAEKKNKPGVIDTLTASDTSVRTAEVVAQ